MHNKERKFKRGKITGIIALMFSLLMAVGSMVLMKLEILPWWAGCLMLFIGLIGTPISTHEIFTPDTKNNKTSKEILNHFDATHKN